MKLNIKRLVRKNFRSFALVCCGLIIVVGAYFLGVNIGNGEIQFGNGHFIQIGNGGLNSGLAPSLNYVTIQQEYNAIKNNYDGKLTTTQLQNGIQHALATSTTDVHTEYFTSSEAKAFNDELNNTFSGIGAELDVNSQNQLVVVSPLAGTPADKAGLKPQDIIKSINGATTSTMTIETAVDKIHGPAGSTVTLGVLRGSQTLTFKITRANIVVPSVNYKVIDNNIGYMQITSFAGDTSSLAQKAANAFRADNVKGVILDLRDNPGGLVNAAINVSSLWVTPGETIMTEKHDSQVVQGFLSTGVDTLTGIPTVVLINDGSASASEITAAAIRDNNQAKLIGQKSYGKGSVQAIINLAGGSEIKVTVYHWFTPDNKNIDIVGIQPDISVNESASDLAKGIDDQLNKAVQYLQSVD